jgi:hypothetical protein
VLLASSTGCARVPTTLVLPPNEAARLSERYGDRVIVRALRRPGESERAVTATVAHEGALLITSNDERIATRPSDELVVKIQYVDGDPGIRGGVVHKGRSEDEVNGGILLAAAGTLSTIGTVAWAASACGGVWGNDIVGTELCAVGFGWLTAAALAVVSVGVVLIVRGSLPTHLWLSPGASVGSAGAFCLHF